MANKYLSANELFKLIENGEFDVDNLLIEDEGSTNKTNELYEDDDNIHVPGSSAGYTSDDGNDDDLRNDPDYQTESNDESTASDVDGDEDGGDVDNDDNTIGVDGATEAVTQEIPRNEQPPDPVSTKGKKRKRNPTMWARNVKKQKRNSGQQYVDKKGNLVPAKKMGPPCRCRKNCFEKLGTSAEESFHAFWELGDKALQDTLLFNAVVCKPVQRRRPRSGVRHDTNMERNNTFEYHIKMSDGKHEVVCKKAFISVYGIGK